VRGIRLLFFEKLLALSIIPLLTCVRSLSLSVSLSLCLSLILSLSLSNTQKKQVDELGARSRMLSAPREKLIELMTSDAEVQITVLYTFKV